jgi:hypothetical protein
MPAMTRRPIFPGHEFKRLRRFSRHLGIVRERRRPELVFFQLDQLRRPVAGSECERESVHRTLLCGDGYRRSSRRSRGVNLGDDAARFRGLGVCRHPAAQDAKRRADLIAVATDRAWKAAARRLSFLCSALLATRGAQSRTARPAPNKFPAPAKKIPCSGRKIPCSLEPIPCSRPCANPCSDACFLPRLAAFRTRFADGARFHRFPMRSRNRWSPSRLSFRNA